MSEWWAGVLLTQAFSGIALVSWYCYILAPSCRATLSSCSHNWLNSNAMLVHFSLSALIFFSYWCSGMHIHICFIRANVNRCEHRLLICAADSILYSKSTTHPTMQITIISSNLFAHLNSLIVYTLLSTPTSLVITSLNFDLLLFNNNNVPWINHFRIGHFDFRAYKATMINCILTNIANLLINCYYLLPTDEDNNKYLPGVVECIQRCINGRSQVHLQFALRRFQLLCVSFARLTEMLVDCLLLLSLLTSSILCKLVL